MGPVPIGIPKIQILALLKNEYLKNYNLKSALWQLSKMYSMGRGGSPQGSPL